MRCLLAEIRSKCHPAFKTSILLLNIMMRLNLHCLCFVYGRCQVGFSKYWTLDMLMWGGGDRDYPLTIQRVSGNKPRLLSNPSKLIHSHLPIRYYRPRTNLLKNVVK